MTDTLPRWRCHKVVRAAKIERIVADDGYGRAFVLDTNITVPFTDELWKRLGTSQTSESLIGGYLVRYEDGYESWSPAEAFENGYTLLGDPAINRDGAWAEWLRFEKIALEEFDRTYPTNDRTKRIKRICVAMCVAKAQDPNRIYLHMPGPEPYRFETLLVPSGTWVPAWVAYYDTVRRVLDAEVGNEP
jgi:hypothetical protein